MDDTEVFYTLVAIAKDGRFISCLQCFGKPVGFSNSVHDFAKDIKLLYDDLDLVNLFVFRYGLFSSFKIS